MTEPLEALLQRVQAATGADRQIDGELAKLAHAIPPDAQWMETNMYGQESLVWYTGGYGDYTWWHPFDYTASIDAALALVGKLLPGWRWGLIHQQGSDGPEADDGYHFWAERGDGGQEVQIGPALTAPLSILTALLTALIAQNKGTA